MSEESFFFLLRKLHSLSANVKVRAQLSEKKTVPADARVKGEMCSVVSSANVEPQVNLAETGYVRILVFNKGASLLPKAGKK